jgi:hypothetical protein
MNRLAITEARNLYRISTYDAASIRTERDSPCNHRTGFQAGIGGAFADNQLEGTQKIPRRTTRVTIACSPSSLLRALWPSAWRRFGVKWTFFAADHSTLCGYDRSFRDGHWPPRIPSREEEPPHRVLLANQRSSIGLESGDSWRKILLHAGVLVPYLRLDECSACPHPVFVPFSRLQNVHVSSSYDLTA